MRKVTGDFFRATFQQPLRTFETFLQNVNHLPKARRLRSLSPESGLFMPNVRHRNANLWTGELQYIRKTNLPDRIDLTTLVDEALGLPAGQGLVEHCHFAYRCDLQALALQSSRFVRSSTFESYVGHVDQAPFQLTLILQRDAYQRLTRMRTIASLTVRIDKPPDAAVFNRLRDPGVSAVASLLTHFGAAKIEVNLKRENRGFISLSVDHVRAFIDRVIGRADVRESMRTLSVKGKREDTDNLEAVDLIEDRLSFEGYVEYDAQRRLDPVACESLLIGALENNEAELRRREP